MIIGCRVICVFAVLINKASLEVSVEADTGGSVVLPCSFPERGLKLQDINAHWRKRGSEYDKYVYEIIKGENSVERQDPRFKNRVETFPLEYERGNFSINITHLTHDDAGRYSCTIRPSYDSQNVKLLIKGKEEEMGSGRVGTSVPFNFPFILLAVLLPIIFITSFIIIYYRKKNQGRLISVTVTQMTFQP